MASPLRELQEFKSLLSTSSDKPREADGPLTWRAGGSEGRQGKGEGGAAGKARRAGKDRAKSLAPRRCTNLELHGKHRKYEKKYFYGQP